MLLWPSDGNFSIRVVVFSCYFHHSGSLSLCCLDNLSPSYRGFNYLYDEQHFIAALAEDVRVVKKLPKQLRLAKKKRLLPVRSPPRGAAPDYYLEKILPEMKEYGAIGLLVPEGGCLQVLFWGSTWKRLLCLHELNSI